MFFGFSVGLRMSSGGQGLEWPDAPVSGHPLNNNKCHGDQCQILSWTKSD